MPPRAGRGSPPGCRAASGGWEDREPLVLGVHEEHHDVLPGRVGAGVGEALPHAVADGEHGLVAMVAVGDVDLQPRHGAAHDLARRRIRQAPHAVAHADGLLHVVDDRRLLLLFVQDVVDDVCPVLVEAPDVFELGAGRLREPDPVLQRPLEHLLVGKDPALRVVAQPHRADETLHLLAADARQVELLLVHPERRPHRGAQDPLLPPLRQQVARPRVAVGLLAVARLHPVQDEPDDVVRVLPVVRLLLLAGR